MVREQFQKEQGRTDQPAREYARSSENGTASLRQFVSIWVRLWLNARVDSFKFKLTIAYDGTNYDGWQVQKTGMGVQQKIEEALAKLFPSKPRVHGSSRTDTGVHAVGMVAHVEIPKAEFKMPVRKLVLALDAWLPEDMRVMSATRCRADFHARFV